MKKTTLNTKSVYAILTCLLFSFMTSCTKDSVDDSIYEEQAKRRISPIKKKTPDVDRMDITIERDGEGELIITILDQKEN